MTQQPKAPFVSMPRKMFDRMMDELRELHTERLWMQSGDHSTAETREAFGDFDAFLDAVALLAIEADEGHELQTPLVNRLADALRELHDFAVTDPHYLHGDRSLNAFQKAGEILQEIGK